MPLPLPDLDTRRWVDLVEEARALIPRYAPHWTDHNVSDPGITLIELLAWLVEQDVYQLNRVPAPHRRKFLALVGAAPQPPRAARALIGAAPPGPAAIDLPEGAELAATAVDGHTHLFRTLAPLRALPTTLHAVRVQPSPDAMPGDYTRLWTEGGIVAVLGDEPQPGAALWLGFAAPLPADEPFRLGFHLAGDRAGAEERQRILEELAAESAACRRPLPPLPRCAEGASETSAAPVPDALEHHSARLVWEYSAAPGDWQPLDPATGQVRDHTRALTLDGTVEVRLPTGTGTLDLGNGPPLHYLRARLAEGAYDSPPLLDAIAVNAVTVEQAVPLSQAYPILPGVVAGGPGPAPQPETAGPQAARLALRLDAAGRIVALAFVADETVPLQQVWYYRPAAADVMGAIVLDLVYLGRGQGGPAELAPSGATPGRAFSSAGQVFRLPRAAVQAGSLRLYTLEPPDASPDDVRWHTWTAVPDFAASSGRDEHVLLDETAATVTTADGNRGRIPPPDAPLLAGYLITAAAAGNLDAARIARLAPTLRNWLLLDAGDFVARAAGDNLGRLLGADPADVWERESPGGYQAAASSLGGIANPRPARGGVAAETLAQAAGRAVAALGARARAITAEDYEALALATPGTAIARVRALPGQHPRYPCLAAPGVVTVIVVPAQAGARPTPSAGLLAVVRRYLDRRRVLGTRAEVVGPRYLTVQVHARVQTLPGASVERVRADVQAALAAFLHPLRGGPAAIAPLARPAPRGALPPAGPDVALPPGVTVLAPAAPPPPTLPPAPPLPPGWPFGRDVYRSEVLQLIDGVAGVDHVLSLELTGDGGPPGCGNLCVGPTELVVSGAHTIEVV